MGQMAPSDGPIGRLRRRPSAPALWTALNSGTALTYRHPLAVPPIPQAQRPWVVTIVTKRSRHVRGGEISGEVPKLLNNVWPNYIVEGLLLISIVAALILRYPHHE